MFLLGFNDCDAGFEVYSSHNTEEEAKQAQKKYKEKTGYNISIKQSINYKGEKYISYNHYSKCAEDNEKFDNLYTHVI